MVNDEQLREAVTRTLEEQGTLARIKAQLRAAVFEALQQQKALQTPNEIISKQPNHLASVPQAELALDLLVDFLQFFKLQHSLQVVEAEAHLDKKQVNKAQLYKKIGLQEPEDKCAGPVLLHLLTHYTSSLNKSSFVHPTTMRFQPEDLPVVQKISVASASTSERSEPTRQEKMAVEEDSVQDEEVESMPEELDESEVEQKEAKSSETLSKPNQTKQEATRLDSTPEPAERLNEQSKQVDDEDEKEFIEPPPPPLRLSAAKTSLLSPHQDSKKPEIRRDSALLDDELALEAARLSSLDAKLMQMEAEDDTGMLQKLKASMELDVSKPPKQHEDDNEDADDNYGSDFEEENVSEISESIQSLSELSTSGTQHKENNAPTIGSSHTQEPTKTEPTPVLVEGTEDDVPIEDESILQSYDYVETVEKD